MSQMFVIIPSALGALAFISLLSCNLTCIVMRFLKEKKETTPLLALGKTVTSAHAWLFSSAALVCVLRILFIGLYVFVLHDASTFFQNVVLVLKYLENFYLMLNIMVVVYIW